LSLGRNISQKARASFGNGEKKNKSPSFHNLDNQNHATCETDDIRINKEEHYFLVVASLVAATSLRQRT
jgi:hypothetical protein